MRMRDRLFLLSLFLGAALTSSAQNWPSYRGPGDQGHAESANLPVEWSESKNVAWKTPIAGKAWSSPVVWGDRVWVTNADPEGRHLSVVCVDKNSGKKLYDKELCKVEKPQFCHDFNSYASPSPVLEEGLVYLTFGSPYTACLKAENGEVVWERKDFVCDHFRGAGSSPFLYR
ncbi:MAG: PQQ-binding-like beta-propeller repeat protein, partial [Akkermansiaceae bacterium]|nr:PQQ-binding-like beta-propeller repeat protein [Akkermansiaceae bacterium]